MAATTDWVSYYKSNRNDGGTIEALYDLSDEELAQVSKEHNQDIDGLRATIAGSGGGNLILIPGMKGTVIFLHQGFTTSTHLGGDAILGFIQGNFSNSPFKVIRRDATNTIAGRVATRGNATNSCPTLGAMLSADDEGEFATLAPGEANTLKDRPNHLFIHPRHFTRCDGPKAMRAKTLAMATINYLNNEAKAAATDEEKEEVTSEMEGLNVFLAFLWASEQGLLSQVGLEEMPESPHLNHQCELVMGKIRKATSSTSTSSNATEGLAVATQSFMLAMNQNEATRIQERAEDKKEKSLIRNMSPRQQSIFPKLCTTHMRTEPVVPAFLKLCLAEKTPHKATNLITNETRKWKGTFSASGFSRFLAGGYLAQEENRGEPGGFTVFMFHPRTLTSAGPSAAALVSGKERIREFFDLPTAESTLAFYQKKEYFIPTNDNELKIVLQTWHDLLELMSVRGTIAVAGIAHVLLHYDGLYSIIQEMFASVEDFGLSILVILDNHLQSFFEMISEMDDVTAATSHQRDFLFRRADRLIEELENRRPPSVVIPQCLRQKPKAVINQPTAKGGESGAASGGGTRADRKADRKRGRDKDRSAEGKAQEPMVNKEPQADWEIPSGKTYTDFFSPGSPSSVGWPKQNDPRHDTRRTMCVKFQCKGKCTTTCPMAHVVRSVMSNKDDTEISARFKRILGK
jgi:hypothetical protein